MVKLKKDNTIILGLSDRNIELLKQDKPIKFNLKELGLDDMDVIIFNGKDESAMLDMFLDQIGPDTIVG
ncbi:MAG: hypothetical protein HC836_37280 [Richelia sp. RM2_1_2]|nr:hypothetical protein [Richelia sp. RM2_1_2]